MHSCQPLHSIKHRWMRLVPIMNAIYSQSSLVNFFNGHYYEVREDLLSWSAAVTASASSTYLGVSGHLVTVTTFAEYQYIQKMTALTVWLGASDLGTSKFNYTWVVGPDTGISANATFKAWAQNQPDNNANTEDCLQIYAPFNNITNNWNDGNCAIAYSFVIEYECPAGYAFSATGCIGKLYCGYEKCLHFIDFNACPSQPCGGNATCTDLPAPSLTRNCTCNTGFTGNATTGCTGLCILSHCANLIVF